METTETSETRFCPKCGQENDSRAFFCTRCGTLLARRPGSGGPSPNNQYQRDDGRSRNDLMPLFALLITLFGFWFLGPLAPLLGVILGHVSLRRMRQTGEDHNRGLAVAALILGYFAIVVGTLLMIFFGWLFCYSLAHEGVHFEWKGWNWT